MNIQDMLWLAFKDLNEKKVRTALTIVMVVIGVAAIVALTSITAGISASISSSLSALGPTAIIVRSSTATGFTVADSATVSSLPNVTSVTSILTGSGSLLAGNQNESVTLIGATPAGLEQLLGGNLSLYQGTTYAEGLTPTAVVGHTVAFPTSLSGEQAVKVGQSATLKLGSRGSAETVTVPIVGVLNSHGGFLVPIDTAVFLPLSAAEVLLHKSSFTEMLVLASNTSNVNSTAASITDIYGSSASVTTTASLLSTAASITGELGLLFGAIAGVSLLVAAIGIMNVMLIAVYERTHEIGIMKSLGFKNNHILFIFLCQALIIGLIGGLVGIGLGAGASYGLSAALSGGGASPKATTTSGPTAAGGGSGFRSGGGGGGSAATTTSTSSISFHPVFPVTTIAYALIIAVLVSMLAGIYPAWRASKMEPIDALREL